LGHIWDLFEYILINIF